MRPRKLSLVVTMALWIVMAVAALAWACSPQPMVLGINPLAATPGEQVRLEGTAVANSPIEIHWNSATGPVVGRTVPDNVGDLSALVIVPDVAPGIYTLMLSSERDRAVGRIAFEVLEGPNRTPAPPAPGTALSSDLWNGFAADPSSEVASLSSEPSPAASSGAISAGLALSALGGISLLVIMAAGRGGLRRASRTR